MVGVDPHTAYIYLMEASENRTSDTWKEVFENIEIQAVVFHAIRKFEKAINGLEIKAMNLIKEEERLESKCKNKKMQRIAKEKLESTEIKTKEAIRVYDMANVLYMWLCEMLR